MNYPRQGLDYYALGNSAPIHKLATLVREQGGIRPMIQRLGGLGQVDRTTAWNNLLAGWQWVNDNPLPDNVDPNSDVAQTRALLLAALVAAQNKLQGDATAGSTDPTYQRVATAFQAHATAARQAEMPSTFLQGIASVSDRFSTGLSNWGALLGDPSKLMLYAGLALGAYWLLPSLLARKRTA